MQSGAQLRQIADRHRKPRSLILAAQHPQRLFRWRQRRQPVIQLALHLDVLPAIFVEPLQPLRIVKPVCACGIFVLARPPRLRHLMHQPFAGGILAVCQLQRIGRGAQPRRQSERQRTSPWCSGGARAGSAASRSAAPAHAARSRFRNGRCAQTNNPARIACGFDEFRRHRIAGHPQLHRLIIDGIGSTENFGAWDRRRTGGADVLQARSGCASHNPDAETCCCAKFAAALPRGRGSCIGQLPISYSLAAHVRSPASFAIVTAR